MRIRMEHSVVFLKKFKDTVERVLHVPGNFTGAVLEMAVVLDAALPAEQVREMLPELLRALKMHSAVFRNVRLNVVFWKSGTEIENRVSPMSMVLLDGFYEDYVQRTETKSFEELAEYLKKYQARAKLILLLTDGAFAIRREEEQKKVMQPFLDKKLILLVAGEREPEIWYRFQKV